MTELNGFYDRDERLTYFIKHKPVQNFGDYLPELFAKYLLTHPQVQSDLYYFVGSVIDDAWIKRALRQNTGFPSGKAVFWGCGKRDASPLSEAGMSLSRFYGVRGPLTRDALGLPADTPLGDTGFLVPLIYPKEADPAPAGAEGPNTICVPHVTEKASDAELLKLSGCAHVLRPQVEASEAGLFGIIDQIRSADFVLSNSLHGAIIACAYDVPFALWDCGYVDAPFKWDDFAQSIGLEARFVKTLTEGRAFYDEVRGQITKPKLAPILAVAPWGYQTHMMLRALASDGVDLSDSDALIAFFEDQAKQDAEGRKALDVENRVYRLRKDNHFAGLAASSSLQLQALKRRLQGA